VSDDGGATWHRAQLGTDLGRYSLREWLATWTPRQAGDYRLLVRAFNGISESQGYELLWNPSGYLRNVIEAITVQAS
jgi:sulfite dehydrogenase